jgi:hypothetical protein
VEGQSGKPITEMSDNDVRMWAVAIQSARRTNPEKFAPGSVASQQAQIIDAEILRRNLYVVYNA